MENIRVEVYWNLHKRLFSVRALEGENKGRVIEHSYGVRLTDAKFVSQPAGRERVRREGVKNVHAFVRGRRLNYDGDESLRHGATTKGITYNPYKYDTFVEVGTEKPVHHASMVLMDVMLGKGKPYPRIVSLDS
jgi:hypothetical protein